MELHDTRWDRFSYDDDIVRQFTFATVIWALVATLVGLFIAPELVLPGASGGLPFPSFGRLRPLHTNAAIFAFAGNAVFAAVYYSSQRLLRARMFSDMLSRIHFWGWQAIIVSAARTLPFGIPQSKEYAELEWPEWASTLGMLFSVLLWMPSWGGMINGLLTLRGAWHKVAENAALEFFVVGLTFYRRAVVCSRDHERGTQQPLSRPPDAPQLVCRALAPVCQGDSPRQGADRELLGAGASAAISATGWSVSGITHR